jgi:hypothetical protein
VPTCTAMEFKISNSTSVLCSVKTAVGALFWSRLYYQGIYWKFYCNFLTTGLHEPKLDRTQNQDNVLFLRPRYWNQGES